jgi:hypothetical protein
LVAIGSMVAWSRSLIASCGSSATVRDGSGRVMDNDGIGK